MMKAIFELVQDIKAARIERVRNVPVFMLTGRPTELLPPGSGMLVIGSGRSEAFEYLQASLEGGKKSAVDDLLMQLKEGAQRSRPMSLARAVEVVRQSPVIADLSYGTKPLVINAVVGMEPDFARGLFVYAGGAFEPEDFKLTEYVLSENESPLQAFVVLQKPSLSAREQQVLDHVPVDSRGMIFGPMDPVMATPAAVFATVTAGIIVAAVGTALTACRPRFEGIDQIVLPEINAGAAAGVKALLAARRDALGRV